MLFYGAQQTNNTVTPYQTSLFGQNGWTLASFFCVFMDEPYKHVKKELGQYPVFLTAHLVNSNPYIIFCLKLNGPWSKEDLPDVSLGSRPRNNFPAVCSLRSSGICFSAWYACYVIHDVMCLLLAIFCVLEMPRKRVVFLNLWIFKWNVERKKSLFLSEVSVTCGA